MAWGRKTGRLGLWLTYHGIEPTVKSFWPRQATLPSPTKQLRTCTSGAAFVIYAKSSGFFLLYKREKLSFWKGKWLAHDKSRLEVIFNCRTRAILNQFSLLRKLKKGGLVGQITKGNVTLYIFFLGELYQQSKCPEKSCGLCTAA